MMYEYLKLPDETSIVYSQLLEDNTIEVAVERPRDMGFDTARCLLPSYRWFEVEGFSEEEMADLDSLVHDNAPLIHRLAREAAKLVA